MSTGGKSIAEPLACQLEWRRPAAGHGGGGAERDVGPQHAAYARRAGVVMGVLEQNRPGTLPGLSFELYGRIHRAPGVCSTSPYSTRPMYWGGQ